MGRKKKEVQLENPRTLIFEKVPVLRERVVIPKKAVICKKEDEDDEIGENGTKQFFACYLLESINPRYKKETYIGFTVNPRRRISQHNGEKTSGARRTKTKRPWKMVMCIHGFPSKVSALKFEWAWQHPLQSLAVRNAAASFTSLTGTASNVKLAYTMLTLREWKYMKLTVNFFSSVSTKFSAGCPNLPEKMKVQVCSMDDLPCYVENNSYEHVDDCMDDDELGSVTSNYFDDYYADIEAPSCDDVELLTEENGMLIESPVKKLDLRTSSSSIDETANDGGLMADYTEKSDNGDSKEEKSSVEPDHKVRKRSLSPITIDNGKDEQAISCISTEDTVNDWGFITEETVGDFINSIEEESNVELGKFSMSQRSSSPITIDDDDDASGEDQPAVSFKADYTTEEINNKDMTRSVEDEGKRSFSPITTDDGKYHPGVSFVSSTDDVAKDWGFFTDYAADETVKGNLINSIEEEENSIECGHQIRKRSLSQPAAISPTSREVEVIDVMTPSPDCRFSLWSKKRRVVCPEIIDLTRSPAFIQL